MWGFPFAKSPREADDGVVKRTKMSVAESTVIRKFVENVKTAGSNRDFVNVVFIIIDGCVLNIMGMKIKSIIRLLSIYFYLHSLLQVFIIKGQFYKRKSKPNFQH